MQQLSHTDSDLQADLTSLVYPQEEGKVSDQETEIPEQDSDQDISEEQSYRETIRGVHCYMVMGPGARL